MYDNKVDRLRNEIKIFEGSQQNTDDYMKLFVTVWSVTKQGSGLTFSQMEDITRETLNEIDRKANQASSSI